MHWNPKYFTTIDSTNNRLRELAEDGAREGTIVTAECQTSGKGRMGRSFLSPEKVGLYMSILVRPNMPAEDALFLTTLTAVACAKAIDDISDVKSGIKWVNDIYVDGKKVCGILTESSVNDKSGQLDYAVVGIGINLFEPEGGYPDDIKTVAGSIFSREDYDEATFAQLKDELAGKIMDYFEKYYEAYPELLYVDEYIDRSILIDHEVTVVREGKPKQAKVLEIDKACRLHVQYEDGIDEWLQSGKVSLKIKK